VVSLRESAVVVETVNHGRFFTSDSLFLSIGSDRHAYALSMIQVMHKVCPSQSAVYDSCATASSSSLIRHFAGMHQPLCQVLELGSTAKLFLLIPQWSFLYHLQIVACIARFNSWLAQLQGIVFPFFFVYGSDPF